MCACTDREQCCGGEWQVAGSAVCTLYATMSLLDYFCHLINCSAGAEKHLCSSALCLCTVKYDTKIGNKKPVLKVFR